MLTAADDGCLRRRRVRHRRLADRRRPDRPAEGAVRAAVPGRVRDRHRPRRGQLAAGSPATRPLSRQICNGWKADRLIASVVLDAGLGEAVAALAGWPGARIVQDNVIWKPPGARSLGLPPRQRLPVVVHAHRDVLVLDRPRRHRRRAAGPWSWPGGRTAGRPEPTRWASSMTPDDYRAAVSAAAEAAGVELDIGAVEVAAGGGSFHHGWTWHGSGPNRSGQPPAGAGAALRQQRRPPQPGRIR